MGQRVARLRIIDSPIAKWWNAQTPEFLLSWLDRVWLPSIYVVQFFENLSPTERLDIENAFNSFEDEF